MTEMTHVAARQRSEKPKQSRKKQKKQKLNAFQRRWASTETDPSYRTRYRSTNLGWAKRALYSWPIWPDVDLEERHCLRTIRQQLADYSKLKKLGAAWRNVMGWEFESNKKKITKRKNRRKCRSRKTHRGSPNQKVIVYFSLVHSFIDDALQGARGRRGRWGREETKKIGLGREKNG